MKKLFCILSCFVLLLSCFSACSHKNTKNNSEASTQPKTFDGNNEFELGKEAKTSEIDSENGKQVFHIDEHGEYMMLDHYDSDGKILYYEEPVYSADGNIKGYKYYDAQKKLLASVDSENNFFDKDGKNITENQFTELLGNLNK